MRRSDMSRTSLKNHGPIVKERNRAVRDGRSRALLAIFSVFAIAIDLQVDVDGLTIIELADRLRMALTVVELGVDFVINIGLQGRKAVRSVGSYNVGLYRASMGVGQVDDRVLQWIIAVVKHLAGEQARFILLRISSKQLRWSRKGRV